MRQHSRARDLRHLKALAWMVSTLVCSGQLSPPAREPLVLSRATQAQSVKRRWQQFLVNEQVEVNALYVSLVLVALSGWKWHRLYLALATTVLWDRYCMIRLSVICCGRAVPLLWRVLDYGSATVPFAEYKGMLRKAQTCQAVRFQVDTLLLS